MFEWKVEDLALMNQKSNIVIGDEKIYTCENTLPVEEKLIFLDKMYKGAMSQILLLITEFKKNKGRLEKDKFGAATPNAMRKWVSEQDTSVIINTGNGNFFIGNFKGNIDTVFLRDYHKTYNNLVDEVFHRTLMYLEKEEIAYFKSIDGYSIAVSSLREMVNKHRTTFGIDLVDDGEDFYIRDKHNTKVKIPLSFEEINMILDKYNQLQQYIDAISYELKNSLKIL